MSAIRLSRLVDMIGLLMAVCGVFGIDGLLDEVECSSRCCGLLISNGHRENALKAGALCVFVWDIAEFA